MTLTLSLDVGQSEETLIKLAEKKLRHKPKFFKIVKKSLDARDKRRIRYVYTVECTDAVPPVQALPRLPKSKLPAAPVVIAGGGPAGLFCAIRLLEHGIRPVLIERGPSVEERTSLIEKFSRGEGLNTDGNVQFGEGGAGTFSDGKLNTGTHSHLNREVLEIFVKFGAPEEILYLNKPHIGSDKLKNIVKNMRNYIISEGGTVEFNAKLTDFCLKNGQISAVKWQKNGQIEVQEASVLVVAVGHSARDTFEMLLSKGVKITQKDFAVGVRIEHLQSEIGRAQYGELYRKLPAADYKLVSHASERAAFTFCMCPGGYVMPAASEEGGVVTNGMSNYARDGINANSALIVQVTGKDFGEGALAGVEFQRKIERAAYRVGGGYRAPVQLVGDFLENRESRAFKSVLPTYPIGTTFADLRAVLPGYVSEALKTAIKDMDGRLKGFACPDAILTAAETRTSAPVRMERGENLQSVSVAGLYPSGEGAGYAGGITSSAADGLRTAEAIFHSFVI